MCGRNFFFFDEKSFFPQILFQRIGEADERPAFFGADPPQIAEMTGLSADAERKRRKRYLFHRPYGPGGFFRLSEKCERQMKVFRCGQAGRADL